METSTIHQADGGREEEWAESQQGHGIVGSRHISRSRPRWSIRQIGIGSMASHRVRWPYETWSQMDSGEEAELVTCNKEIQMKGCNRSSKINDKTRMSNPWGISHVAPPSPGHIVGVHTRAYRHPKEKANEEGAKTPSVVTTGRLHKSVGPHWPWTTMFTARCKHSVGLYR